MQDSGIKTPQELWNLIWPWIVEVFQNYWPWVLEILSYWPALLILAGFLFLIGGLIEFIKYEERPKPHTLRSKRFSLIEFIESDERFALIVGVVFFVIFGGFGVFFFIKTPHELWNLIWPWIVEVFQNYWPWVVEVFQSYWPWIVKIFLNYWPALLILTGFLFLICGLIEFIEWKELDVLILGILYFIIFGGFGVYLFIKTPSEVWKRFLQLDFVSFLFDGAWYDVTLKVSAAIGILGLILKLLFKFIRAIFGPKLVKK